jgi:hypothetical protein
MARTENGKSARIRTFVEADLARLQDDLRATGMQKPSRDDVVSALVFMAARLPVDVVKGVMEAYWKAKT